MVLVLAPIGSYGAGYSTLDSARMMETNLEFENSLIYTTIEAGGPFINNIDETSVFVVSENSSIELDELLVYGHGRDKNNGNGNAYGG